MFFIEANLVDIENRDIYSAKVTIKDKKIVSIERINKSLHSYILPGFIDAHIHIESSMLIPSRFAQVAVTHGTVATISDPHEIANVLGIDGIDFMIENIKDIDFKIFYGASPCVPATDFETSGAKLGIKEIDELLKRDDIYYLSEVMNFPGVINDEKEIIKKIELAKKYKKPIDGHAPGLRGKELKKYIDAGISTDHEAYGFNEAKEKLQNGMKILLREGSAAKNYEALHPLIDDFYENMMFCSDDKHPNDLAKGHINELVKRAINDGHELFKVLNMACINPIKHYNLDVGSLKKGDFADFIEVKDLKDFKILKTVINGKIVYENEKSKIEPKISNPINNFNTEKKSYKDFEIHENCKEYRVISAIENQLITKEMDVKLQKENSKILPDIERDILLISITNRYENKKPSVSFVHGFGLKRGAIASSVAHDSHNIVSVGCDEKSMAKAVNAIIDSKGGICAVYEDEILHLPLPYAGLMSKEDGFEVAKEYEKIDTFVKQRLKSTLQAPFMTLSFMALLVIPDIKLSDKGLFDANAFHFVRECKI